jgi:hypothetical protein
MRETSRNDCKSEMILSARQLTVNAPKKTAGLLKKLLLAKRIASQARLGTITGGGTIGNPTAAN